VSLDGNATVSGALTLTDGTLTVGAHTLTISGSSITRGNGNIDASNGSALLSFTNGSALTLPSSCFTGNINRMTLNGAGGVSLGSNTTVSSTLTLTSGTLTVGANTLTLANNSAPVRTSGNIDLSNASAEIEFTNTSGVTLPASLFSGNISKWKMNGTGGITLNGNTTITTTLTLSAGKLIIPASTTLSLGSTSADIDDLSGSSSSYIVTTNNTSAIRRYVNSKNDHLYTFPMGDATYYSPMTFRLNNSTSSISNAYLTTYVVDGYVPGFNQSQYITKISRYWSVEPFGMTSPNYDISYTYDDNDLSGNETALLPIKKSGATWYKPNNAVNITTGTKEGVGSVNDVTNTLTWTGLTTFSFDTGTGDEAQALPIHLLYFTAKPQSNRVRLDWATASETNNDYFTVERSQDGEHFNELFKKPGAGITTTNLYYFGYDNKPLTGTSYYRLKQTDFDGKFEYSDIESVSLQASVVLDGLKIYPNPSEDNVIHVDFSSESKQEVTCVLHDAVGKEIATEIFEVQKGPNGFTLSYPSVATGMYILEIRSSEGGVHQTQLKLGK